ncbi:MAG TPA: hypothetical protein VJ111_01045 [Chitinophagaceae bacterium]|nr:hypothetical protein [Chitinophagaceae bacterium]
MKNIFLFFIAITVVLFTLSSCAASKKDCNGVKHQKHKGGFYI